VAAFATAFLILVAPGVVMYPFEGYWSAGLQLLGVIVGFIVLEGLLLLKIYRVSRRVGELEEA